MAAGYSGRAQTFHALIVADTQDPELTKACERDMITLHRQFTVIASAIKYQLKEQYFAGSAFGRKQLDEALRQLTPQPNDVVFLYYTGHGYNAPGRSDRFPILLLEKAEHNLGQNPGLSAIHDMLKSKKPRLCVTMGDCCNLLMNLTRGMTGKRVALKPLPSDSLNVAYRSLFLDVKGDVLIASSQPPQQACAHPDSGSFYTRAFDDALLHAARTNKPSTWENLLSDAQNRLILFKATQTKQSIYAVHVQEVPVPELAQAPLPVDRNRIVQENKLSDQQLREFRTQTEHKVAEFQRYLTIVADPDQQDNIRELAIENALRLFMPNTSMQVSSTRDKKVKEYALDSYLRRLKNLNQEKKYVDINLTFYDVALIGDWEPTKEGYSTTATYFQQFQAFDRKGQILYGDKTAKQVEVDLRDRKDPFYEEHKWIVLLGNVRITEATPKKSVQ
ncbi:hypothetical protein GCM10023187_18860 [Nibrella viscosa]|uniref:Peptidase C14 caspase domain-containing protein n=1 Tax=Nibrella viscosa TaxID=1084524 RepID=A0ABP8KAM8_9BACT